METVVAAGGGREVVRMRMRMRGEEGRTGRADGVAAKESVSVSGGVCGGARRRMMCGGARSGRSGRTTCGGGVTTMSGGGAMTWCGERGGRGVGVVAWLCRVGVLGWWW